MRLLIPITGVALLVMSSCGPGNQQPTEVAEQKNDTATMQPEVIRDTIDFGILYQEYQRALPDVGDTAIWGSWEEHESAPHRHLAWQKAESGRKNRDSRLDSNGLPAALHWQSVQEDSLFYLPTAQHWVRFTSRDRGDNLGQTYFHQGYMRGLKTYFIAGCGIRPGSTCDFYLLDSLYGTVRAVRNQYDNPYRYVAWSAESGILTFIANDSFGGSGTFMKLLKAEQDSTGVKYDHLLQKQIKGWTVADLRTHQGSFMIEVDVPPGDSTMAAIQGSSAAGDTERELHWLKLSIQPANP